MYPNDENMIVVPNNKKKGDYCEHVCLISWMNIDYKENDEKKNFLANPKHQYHVSEYGGHGCSTQSK